MKTEIKTNTQEKTININPWVLWIAQKNEIAKRNERAEEYMDRCQRKMALKENRKKQLRENIILGLLWVLLIVTIILKFSNGNGNVKEYISMQGKLQGKCVLLENGNVHEVSEEYANYSSEPMQVTVVLDNNGTENSDDDIIVKVLN